ncbi:HAD family hydrolase [Planctopirus hydrillae]|uniref:Haloacid dehalogenase n=1 Tax=Planctopirus hydrillae TaxID=1841610 RepID=A0A1C3E6L5_9PLAN|nr:HAD family hydrolase [Planctopirus hydrillae]ODA28881.1 hypothetical protein A6X21_10270 [Planctopirus hydrillae]
MPHRFLRDRSIRCVALDAFGTIITPGESIVTIYHRAGHQRGSTLSEVEVGSRFRMAYRSRQTGTRTSHAEEIRFWHDVVATVFQELPPQKIDDCFDELWHKFADPGSWRLFPDVVPALDALKASGIKVLLASNFDNRLIEILRGFSLLDRFDELLISSQVGWRKPAPEFYRAIFEAAGTKSPSISPAQIFMVGDDYEHDVEAARRAGFSAIQICREPAHEVVLPSQISSLTELFENS